MREEIRPLDLVVPDQFIDHTQRRVSTFFGDGIVGHVGLARPGLPDWPALLEEAARERARTVHRGGTYVCIEGPQFSTRGGVRVYRGWGMSVIGMTNMPEAKLAREAELPLRHPRARHRLRRAGIATHDAVTVEAVVAEPDEERRAGADVLRRAIPRPGSRLRRRLRPGAAQDAVITDPALFPPRVPARASAP